jgi:D-glycero-D-manno-heptose 1,7-bisphosphate phosphatase
MSSGKPAIFLDRDGVLVEDVDILRTVDQVRILPGAFEFMEGARRMGFALAVVSNQTVVARGLATEAAVEAVNAHINMALLAGSGVGIDRFYVCPHHPQATLEAYRMDCACRKPLPGLLRRASEELGLDLARSWMIGDRPSDIVAGCRAGCRTILVETGKHLEAPIASAHHDPNIRPDYVCRDLVEALAVITRSEEA